MLRPRIEIRLGWVAEYVFASDRPHQSVFLVKCCPGSDGLATLWRVHFVDVGTGLATFVEGPDFTLVYDGGSNDDLALGSRNRFLAHLRKVRRDEDSEKKVRVDAAYLNMFKDTAGERVGRAGIRLAHLVNDALDPAYEGPTE